MNSLKLFIYFFSINLCSLLAQTNIKFEHITSENGLSQNDVNTIIQDDEGFMWFGTHDGLNKYDGYTFEVFRHQEGQPNSIPNNLIQSLEKDKDGNLWIINTNAGITKFNPRTEVFTNFKHDKRRLNSSPSSNSKSIYVDHSNRLWIATNAGVSMLDLNNTELGFSHYAIFEKYNKGPAIVNAIFQTSDEQIWIGTEIGLFKAFFNGKSNITFVEVTEDLMVDYTPRVYTMYEDKYQNFLIGTDRGIFTKAKQETSFYKILSNIIFDLEIDHDNNIWAGSISGIHKLDYNKLTNTFTFKETFEYNISNPFGLNRNSIRSIYKDKLGVMWAGTKGGGVNKFSPLINPFEVIKKSINPHSLSYNNIRSIYEDSNGVLWIGTEEGNLNYNLTANDYNNGFYQIEDTRNVFAMEEVVVNDKKYLYLGRQSDKNLSRILLKKGKIYTQKDIENIPHSNGSVFALHYNDDILWIGTYSRGLCKHEINGTADHKEFNYDTNNSNLSSKVIRSLFEDREGNLWIGTAEGLNLIPKKEIKKKVPEITVFKHQKDNKQSLSNNYVLDIYQSKNGIIWVGTLGGGLNALKYKQGAPTVFKRITTENGLPNNIIKGIQEDAQGNLWITSNKGLTRYTIENANVLNFSTSDGLQGEEFLELSRFKNNKGKLFFGGTNGVNVFKPEEVIEVKSAANPLLANFYLLNKKVNPGEKVKDRVLLKNGLNYTESISLQPKENSFSIEFSSTNYQASEKNRFLYKLEGFDENWQEVGAKKRFATYTNIPPGTYSFRLKTLNNSGKPNEVEKQLQINVLAPWWKTTTALLIYGIIFIGLLIAFRRFTIVRAEEKHQYQVSKLEKKQSEELQQMKLEFFTNISHEFRTPLTLIKGPLDVLEKNNEIWSSSQRQKQYDLMKKNTNYLLRLVNQLLDFRRVDREKMALKISNLDLVLFVEETAGPFAFLATKKKIDFKIIADKSHLIIPFDPDALEKILNNLLFNAFKFTPEGKSIFLEIHDGETYNNPQLLDKKLNLEDFMVLQIKDTGKGISEDKVKHIFERYYLDRNQNIQGAGIGLSFTKKLVELHDGFIDVSSTENEGTTFSVLLPKHQNKISTAKLIELENEVKAEQPINLAPDLASLKTELKEELAKSTKSISSNLKTNTTKVLVVDDNEDIRSFIINGVEAKYEIIEAANGQEGLELAVKEKPLVIISDIMMPVMDGFEMVSKLIVDERVGHIPIIMLTAKSSKETETKALGLGVVDFVRKPFDLDVLLLKVNNVIKKQEKLRTNYNEKVSIEPKEIEVTSNDQRFLQQAMHLVEENMMNTEFSVEMLVSEMGMSRSNLYLKLKEITGLSSSEFIRSVRLKRAVQLLKKSDMSVKEIMYMTGFNTASYFSKCFKKQYGVVPSEYMKNLNKKQNTLKDYLS